MDCPALHEGKLSEGEWSRVQKRIIQVKVESQVTAAQCSKAEQVQLRTSKFS
jgi:hypothetical protein